MEKAQPTHWLQLPAGTSHVVFHTLPERLARTLWPDHPGDEQAQFETGFTQAGSSATFRKELTEAARAGRLRLSNPLTLGAHPCRAVSDIDGGLVSVSDLRRYLAERGIGVSFAGIPHEAVSSGSFGAISHERESPSAKLASSVPNEAATADGDAGSPNGAGAVDKPSPVRRKTWKDVAWLHMVEKLRAGKFATAVALNHALHDDAGSTGSPFDKGEGTYRGSLWVREISTPLALKTIQNNWMELKAAALG